MTSTFILPRRTHALGACRTCRRRHVKCDQKRPSCRTCRSLGVTCERPPSKVRWMQNPHTGDSAEDQREARRHLYTEQSRLSMTSSLRSRLVSGSINASLAEIDLRTRDIDNPPTGDIIVGPFAVLGLPTPESQRGDNVVQQQAEQDALDSTSVESEAHIAQPISPPMIEDSSEAIAQPTTFAQTSFVSDSVCHFDDFLHWSDLLGCSPDALDWNPAPLSSDRNLVTNLAALSSDFEIDPMPVNRPANGGTFSDVPDGNGLLQMIEPTEMASTLLHAASLTEAPFLFKHFHDNVIPQTMPMPLGKKSPWKILNVPAAMVTYSDLTILGSRNVNHARQANLYGLLACSAVHLSMYPSASSSDTAQHWQETAENMFELARENMQMSIKYETQEPKTAKYKDQLMAICCLTEYAILSGQQHYARGFLIHAEYILRMRGLPKRRISPKARLLHHVYTWLRLVGESTYVLHDYQPSATFIEVLDSDFRPHRPDPPCQIRSEAHQKVPQLDDFLRLEAHHSDSDLNIDDPKDQETGLHDIHLQDSRNFSDTLYKQIYGIPETWLTLVSQTTRLANVMETFRVARQSQKKASLEAWETLHRRSEHLENMICSFVLRHDRRIRPKHTDSSKPHEPMLRALNSALLIFFYRRVRQVHPAVLDGYVENVITALADFQEAVPAEHPMSPATAWPMFIAGCEALTASRRGAVLQFFNKAESICRFPIFKTAREILTSVWNQQDQHLETKRRDPMPTWIDVVKREQIWPIFC
ncbi:putative C6 transcription factor [Aspergillus udagawae]|uniref:Putative C6 transcription factor n=1 Tax=Aspergillus udagawae TaxID=91492 RepID=A0A8H3NJU3_9EURO|nr:putative C6 transcription factor [Aspergillus udagawae]